MLMVTHHIYLYDWKYVVVHYFFMHYFAILTSSHHVQMGDVGRMGRLLRINPTRPAYGNCYMVLEVFYRGVDFASPTLVLIAPYRMQKILLLLLFFLMLN